MQNIGDGSLFDLKPANFNGVKCFSFRRIVDEADENMDDSFDTNCKPALQKLFPVLKEFIFGDWVQKFC